jgi:hypothetical protein
LAWKGKLLIKSVMCKWILTKTKFRNLNVYEIEVILPSNLTRFAWGKKTSEKDVILSSGHDVVTAFTLFKVNRLIVYYKRDILIALILKSTDTSSSSSLNEPEYYRTCDMRLMSNTMIGKQKSVKVDTRIFLTAPYTCPVLTILKRRIDIDIDNSSAANFKIFFLL